MSLKKTQVESFYKKNGFFANAFCIYILDFTMAQCLCHETCLLPQSGQKS